jgi:hypothetical protein
MAFIDLPDKKAKRWSITQKILSGGLCLILLFGYRKKNSQTACREFQKRLFLKFGKFC